MTPPARVLVLGIDAASPALLARWIGDGSLPNLRRLAGRGLSGDVAGVEGYFVGSTWPSFYTGQTPARHGLHYLVQLVPGSYALRHRTEVGLVEPPPLWRLASRAGRRVAVLDVPLSRLEPDLDGIQTLEWGVHDAVYGFRTQPESLKDWVLREHGTHPQGPVCDARRATADDYRGFVEGLERGAQRRGELTRELLARGGWDFFMQVFSEMHCCGHQCWHLHDPAHPAHDPALAAAVGDPLLRVYRAVDAAIGRILEVAGDARVVVLSGHGMSHWFGAGFLLRDILCALGVTRPLPETRSAADRARELAAPLWRRLPGPLRRGLAPLRARLAPDPHERDRVPRLDVDAAASDCFPLRNGFAVGGIRLNLAGREPNGRIEPGAPAQAFCDELAQALLEIVDECSGQPLVRRVVRTAELFSGERLDELPDLLVEWNDAVPVGSTELAGGQGAAIRARSPRLGILEGANGYGRSGEHRRTGGFFAAGPGIAPGRLGRAVSVLDFAPTFARWLDLASGDWDGRPIPELAGPGAASEPEPGAS